MLLFIILLSTGFLFLTYYVFHLRKQIQKLTEEINRFLLYPDARPETLKEGLALQSHKSDTKTGSTASLRKTVQPRTRNRNDTVY